MVDVEECPLVWGFFLKTRSIPEIYSKAWLLTHKARKPYQESSAPNDITRDK
jgi:hypothetical protein